MKAVIMAGGLGKRLRPFTYSIPKPLLPVGEKPILEIIIEQLRHYGFNDIIITTHYKSELIEAYFRDGTSLDVNIEYVKENEILGTAGSLTLIKNIDNQPFLVMNGDILTKVNFKKLMDYHIQMNADITVGIKKYEIQIPYGVVEIQGEEIIDVREKPILNFYINAGIYIISPLVIDIIPKNKYIGIPEVILKLITQHRKVISYKIEEYWRDIGVVDDIEKGNKEMIDLDKYEEEKM